MKIAIIGAGLAGSECAYILAEHYNLEVSLFEMKPKKMTPAQVSPNLFAELVCSNSLKSNSRLNPAGTLKGEMEQLGSLVMSCAKNTSVPAGDSLAVDRELFSDMITQKLKSHKNIKIIEMTVEYIEQILTFGDFSFVVVATGPLTDDKLAENLCKITESQELYFYDAIAPIIDGSTIDQSIAFIANRQTRTHSYEKAQLNAKNTTLPETPLGEIPRNSEQIPIPEETGDYLNIPLNKEEYYNFVEKLVAGPKVPHRAFEEPRYFNGCQPIEVLAERGPKTLSFGPMKPIGLVNPTTGKRPYAAVQLRKEKQGDSAWNMVGFQTRLTWGAQKEILRSLPGLKDAEFYRMGSMHRNTYFVSPNILNKDLSLKTNHKIFLAGQIMGVEGYLESSAMGVLIAHIIGNKLCYKKEISLPPLNTSLGCLANYCLNAEAKHFTPMNIHWGLFTELTEDDFKQFSQHEAQFFKNKKIDKSTKRDLMAKRSEHLFHNWIQFNNLTLKETNTQEES